MFVSTNSEDTDACKYILDTFNMVDSDTKTRLRKMLNSLPIDEVLAFCRDLRDEIMYNVLDLSFDSACDIEETPEPVINSESIHDLPQYDDFDEGYYDEEEQINIFCTSLASPGAETRPKARRLNSYRPAIVINAVFGLSSSISICQ